MPHALTNQARFNASAKEGSLAMDSSAKIEMSALLEDVFHKNAPALILLAFSSVASVWMVTKTSEMAVWIPTNVI